MSASDSGAFAMPSPAKSEALLAEGGGATIVDTSQLGVADAMAGPDATPGDAVALDASMGGSLDAGRGAKTTASKAKADGGGAKKK